MSDNDNLIPNESVEQAPQEEQALQQEQPQQEQPQQEQPQEEPKKGKRRKKEPLTKEQKRKKTVRGLVITAIVLSCIIVLFGVFAIVNVVGVKGLVEEAAAFDKVEYGAGQQLVPEYEKDPGKEIGWYTFTTDREVKVMQLTDIHIGAGFASLQKDSWALNAVSTMIRTDKPDLVIVTGDIAYPVPFQSGTFNNLNATKIFATMMESLGVYWTFAFGNHDTEAYSMYTRQDICDWYAEQNFKYCLFQPNTHEQEGQDKENFGYGNNVIKVKNSLGKVTHAFVLFDSHSYTDGDAFGALWKYDNIHQDQIDWYKAEMDAINAANNDGSKVENTAYFHIPLREYRKVWAKVRTWCEANKSNIDYFADYDNASPVDPIQIGAAEDQILYYYGVMGEDDKSKNGERTWGVFCGVPDATLYPVVDGVEQDGVFFTTAQEYNMTGIFCGHDHLNNFSVEYKGIRLTYGMSTDYLAYAGIYKKKAQRGNTTITVRVDGSFAVEPRNYYEDYEVTQKH